MNAFEYASDQVWAIRVHYGDDGRIESPDLALILNIAARANDPDFEAAVLKAQARHMEARQAALAPVDGIAQVNVIGPIFRYANLFTEVSGATSVSAIQADLSKAADDGMVRAILLNVDSSGGQVDGISDLADSIRAASKKKPIVAYSDGAIASGALWLGSAASKVIVSDTAMAGSVGVVANLRTNGKRPGEYEFVSSVSPKKRTNPETDEGRAQIQAHVDSVAQVFVQKLAAYRGVSIEKVLSDFGQGDVLVGAAAVAAGMADEVGTRDSVLAALKPKPSRVYSLGARSAAMNPQTRSKRMNPEEFTAEQQAAITQQIEAARAEARAVERSRIYGILTLPEAEGRESLARTVALETDLSSEAAAKLMAAAPKAAAAVIDPKKQADVEFVRQMAKIQNPDVGVDAGGDGMEQSEIDAEVARILKAGR